MILNKLSRKTGRMLFACSLIAGVVGSAPHAQAALTDIANAPMVTSSSTSVLPNVFLMMDDSGSMSWTFMPDTADDFDGKVGYASSHCNGVYYDPSITYAPPLDSTGVSYPGMSFTAAQYDGFNTAAGTLSTSTGKGTVDLSAQFKKDMYIPYSANSTYSSYGGLSDTAQPAYYYKYSGTQTTPLLKNYNNTSSTFYTECNTAPGYKATIKINSATNPSTISSVTVGGTTITSGSSASTTTTTSTVASNLAAKITAAGYSASVSSNTITITAPLTAPPSGTPSPVVNVSAGTVSTTVTAFPATLFTKVLVGATSGPGGTDERTNFANWFSYYRTRINMMKTSTGLAFKPIDNRFRVGFATMNNNGGNMFQNVDTFNATNKSAWYTMLYSTSANNSTPLLKALSNAGLMYAHKLPSNKLNGVTATDPIQYSCQQNFTILSTDGYWNDATNSTLSGASVGNQDNTEPRPFYDGATVTYSLSTTQTIQSQTQWTQSTSQYQKETLQIQSSTSTLRKQTSQLQQTTSQLQTQTAQLTNTTYQLQKQAAQLQKQTTQLRATTERFRKCPSNGSPGWGTCVDITFDCSSGTGDSINKYCRASAPATITGVATCSVGSTTNPATLACNSVVTNAYTGTSSCTATTIPDSSGNTTQCQTVGTWSDTSSTCTVTTPNFSGNMTLCQYRIKSTTGVGSCSAIAKSTGPTTYSVINPVDCTTAGSWSDASSTCTATAPDSSGHSTQCQYVTQSTTGVGSCTPIAASSGPSYSVINPVACNTVVTSGYASASSCNASAVPDGSGNTTQCQYSAWSTPPISATSCTPLAQSVGPSYTVGTATQCPTSDTIVGVQNPCSNSSSGGATITCTTNNTAPVLVAPPCNSQLATASNNWTRTQCNLTTLSSAPADPSTCNNDPATPANGYVTTSCTPSTSVPTNTTSCTAAAASASNLWKATSCTYVSSTGGTSNTLADVAEYYYMTDLRTSALSNATGALGSDVSANMVPTSGLDGASWQHMTTFTLGLGAVGRMVFSPTYQTDTSGDYVSVRDGVTANPTATIPVCSWQSNGTTCNWPTPNVSGTPENIDDLWHAAVNGRGTYFSATNPTTLTGALSSALLGVTARAGAAAAATTSNPNVTSGDNFIFDSTFVTNEWTGEFSRSQLDLSTGLPSGTSDWSARDMLDAKTPRTIYTFDSTAANHLKPFQWASLTAAEQANFSLASISTLSQFCPVGVTCLSAADQTSAAGANLVNFLRGDRSNEGVVSDTSKYYRQRMHLLGDIVDAEAAYVKLPRFSYTDPGYAGYILAQAPRIGKVYVGANDGMLHAFDATTGDESWAYVPRLVFPSLYKLADKNYSILHQYFVDGTPIQADAFFQAPGESAPSWRTILVGGLNAGGRGYYALDVTDPASPKALWEFTDTNMGYTYGNPVITKLKDGTWVVMVSSGYNNVSPGDGQGYLYVLNAATGAIIRVISTNTGSTGTPSGLARINGWVNDSAKDNTTLSVYGGDLLGNLWRFDVNGDVGAAGYDAQKLVTLVAPGGAPQPITVQPAFDLCGGMRTVFVGTGRYLGLTDLGDTQQQSFYAVKDNLDTNTFANPRSAGSGFVHQIETATTCPAGTSTAVCTSGQSVRTSTNTPVDLRAGHDNGWYLDFLEPGERDNTDPSNVLSAMAFNTNVPSSSACMVGGYSYSYFLKSCTGGAVASANNVVTVSLANAMATRPVVVKLPNNTFVSLTRVTSASAAAAPGTIPVPTHCVGGTCVTTPDPGKQPSNPRRVSWRELPTDQ